MTIQQFFKFAGAVTMALGAGFIFAPDLMLAAVYGPTASDIGFTRYLGTALTGFGVLNWYGARFASKPDIALVALVANGTSLVLATCINLSEILAGNATVGTMPVLVLHLGFALGFGYFIRQTRTKLAPR